MSMTFKCGYCGGIVRVAEACEDGQRVYHAACLAEKQGDICAKCRQGLLSGMYTAMGKKWHEECFQCKGCGEVLFAEVANPHGVEGVYRATHKISKVGAMSGIRGGGRREIIFCVAGVDAYHPGCLPKAKRRLSVPIPTLTLPSPGSTFPVSPSHIGSPSGYSGPGGGLSSPTPSPNPTPRSARLSPAAHKHDASRHSGGNVVGRKKSPSPFALPGGGGGGGFQDPNQQLPSVLELDGAIWSINHYGQAVCQQDATQRAKVKIGSWPEIKKEAAALRLASGTGVLEVIGKILTRNGKALLLTAWKNGGDVFSKSADTAGQGLDEPFARTVFAKLMKALARCRKQNLAHRYITLENVILGSMKGPSYLCNFKLSRRYQENEKASDVVGGPVHVSPEALLMLEDNSPEGYDPFTTDMWAAGVCLYQMLAGRDPKWVRKLPCGLLPGSSGYGEVPCERDVSKYYKLVCSGPGPVPRSVSGDARSLLEWVLDPDHTKRATPLQALSHPWLAALSINPSEGRKLVRLSDNTSLLLVVLCAGVASLTPKRKQFLLHTAVVACLDVLAVRCVTGNPLQKNGDEIEQCYTTAGLVAAVMCCDVNIIDKIEERDESLRPPDSARVLLSARGPGETKVMKRETRSRSMLGIRRESLPLNIEKRMRGWTKAEVRRFPDGFDHQQDGFVRKTPRVTRKPVEVVPDGPALEPGAFRKRCGSTVRSKKKPQKNSLTNPGSPSTGKSPSKQPPKTPKNPLGTQEDDDDDYVPLQRSKTDGILTAEPPSMQTPVEKTTKQFPKSQEPPPLRVVSPAGSQNAVTPPSRRAPSPPSSGSPVTSPRKQTTNAVKLKDLKKKKREASPPAPGDAARTSPPTIADDEDGAPGSDDGSEKRKNQSNINKKPMPLLKLSAIAKDTGMATGRTTARSEAVPLTSRTKGSNATDKTEKKKKRHGSGSPTRKSARHSPFAYHSAALRHEMNRAQQDRPTAPVPSIENYLQSVQREMTGQGRGGGGAPTSPPLSPKKKTGGTRGLYAAVFGPNSNEL